VLIWFIQDGKWANKFDEWLASVVLWISAWAGVMCVDYLVFRRGKIDVNALYAPPHQSIYGDVNWAAVISMLAGVVAGWAWGYGLVKFLQGPIATHTHNVDISWLTGFGVAAILYYVLRPFLAKEAQPSVAATS
jgi:cytosine/uracil/thiamine/allantoin permease